MQRAIARGRSDLLIFEACPLRTKRKKGDGCVMNAHLGGRQILRVFALFWLASIVAAPTPRADCQDDSVSDCMDRAKDAAQAVLTDPGNAVDHAREAGKAAGNCIQCASEELSNKLRAFTPHTYTSGYQP
jgi:hypothetical protein